MDVDELVETHLRRSHEAGAWPAIRAHGLLLTTPTRHLAGEFATDLITHAAAVTDNAAPCLPKLSPTPGGSCDLDHDPVRDVQSTASGSSGWC